MAPVFVIQLFLIDFVISFPLQHHWRERLLHHDHLAHQQRSTNTNARALVAGTVGSNYEKSENNVSTNTVQKRQILNPLTVTIVFGYAKRRGLPPGPAEPRLSCTYNWTSFKSQEYTDTLVINGSTFWTPATATPRYWDDQNSPLKLKRWLHRRKTRVGLLRHFIWKKFHLFDDEIHLIINRWVFIKRKVPENTSKHVQVSANVPILLRHLALSQTVLGLVGRYAFPPDSTTNKDGSSQLLSGLQN